MLVAHHADTSVYWENGFLVNGPGVREAVVPALFGKIRTPKKRHPRSTPRPPITAAARVLIALPIIGNYKRIWFVLLWFCGFNRVGEGQSAGLSSCLVNIIIIIGLLKWPVLQDWQGFAIVPKTPHFYKKCRNSLNVSEKDREIRATKPHFKSLICVPSFTDKRLRHYHN